MVDEWKGREGKEGVRMEGKVRVTARNIGNEGNGKGSVEN